MLFFIGHLFLIVHKLLFFVSQMHVYSPCNAGQLLVVRNNHSVNNIVLQYSGYKSGFQAEIQEFPRVCPERARLMSNCLKENKCQRGRTGAGRINIFIDE